jgi:O-acetyl-ADP-ribose deacetylase (regulator of RNase III)
MTITYTQGNLLDANVDAIVNTVNEVGVMGKGIALMFREAFPENAKAYMAACEAGDVKVGHMFVTRNPSELIGPRWIINFPTKKHWRHPSRLKWISDGMADLVRVVERLGIKSIAIPPLGCGAGGLEWSQVRCEIEAALSSLGGVDAFVYAPTNVYQNAPKRDGVETLTPARALIAEIVRRYWVLGIECTNLEVQKLAWFLQRMIGKSGIEANLKLNFVPHKFGPYADNLRHLLNELDGSYLRCERRLSDAGPLDPIAFNDEKASVVKEYIESDPAKPYIPALEQTAEIIRGFESPLGMELLATVDWLMSVGNCAPNRDAIKAGLAEWPAGKTAAKRKLRIFSDRLVDLALARLTPLYS